MNPSDDDTILAGLIAGELDPGDPGAQALLERQPALRGRVERLRALAGQLDAHGHDERDVVGHAGAPETRLAGVVPSLRTKRWRPPFWLLVAALVAIAWFAAQGARPPAGPDSMLGAQGKLLPSGVTDPCDHFEWHLPRAPEGTFRLRFFGVGVGAAPTLLFEVTGLTDSQWAPDARQKQLFTQRMEWTVESLAQDGRTPVASGSATVYLQQ